MRKSIIVALSVVFLIGATALVASALEGSPGPPGDVEFQPGPGQGPPPGDPGGDFGRRFKGHGPKERGQAFVKELGLTEEQQDKMRQLRVSFRDRTRKTRMSLMSLKDEKSTMLESGAVNMEKLAKLDDEIVKTKTELMRERLKMQRDRLSLLTPEQIKKLGQFKGHKHRGGRHAKFRGRHAKLDM